MEQGPLLIYSDSRFYTKCHYLRQRSNDVWSTPRHSPCSPLSWVVQVSRRATPDVQPSFSTSTFTGTKNLGAPEKINLRKYDAG